MAEYSDDGVGWMPIDEHTEVFDTPANYAAGYTRVLYLRVRNTGTLHVNYEMRTVSTDLNDISPSDSLLFGVTESLDNVPFATHEDARNAVTAFGEPSSCITSGELSPDSNAHLFAIVIYMPENTRRSIESNKTDPSITVGLSFHARQHNLPEGGFTHQINSAETSIHIPNIKYCNIISAFYMAHESNTINNDYDDKNTCHIIQDDCKINDLQLLQPCT